MIYLAVVYGQNLLEFGSDLRINFYFIGMSISTCLFAYILFKVFKNVATSFYLFMCIGEFFNQAFCKGGITYIDICGGVLGVIYILFEDNIKIVLKKWKR